MGSARLVHTFKEGIVVEYTRTYGLQFALRHFLAQIQWTVRLGKCLCATLALQDHLREGKPLNLNNEIKMNTKIFKPINIRMGEHRLVCKNQENRSPRAEKSAVPNF